MPVVFDVSQTTAAFLERRINEEIEQGGGAVRIRCACRADRSIRAGEVRRQLAGS
jgi:hypothetical protein